MSEDARLAAELRELSTTGEACDGMVYVEIAGGELRTVQIATQLLDLNRQRQLEAGLKQAVNAALRAHQQAVLQFVDQLGGGPDSAQLDRIESQLAGILARRTR